MATASKSLSATQIWTTEPGEKRSVGVIHIVITALLIGIGFVVGAFGSISFPLGFGVNFFWTGIAVQQVGSIWFGSLGRNRRDNLPLLLERDCWHAVLVSPGLHPRELCSGLLTRLGLPHI